MSVITRQVLDKLLDKLHMAHRQRERDLATAGQHPTWVVLSVDTFVDDYVHAIRTAPRLVLVRHLLGVIWGLTNAPKQAAREQARQQRAEAKQLCAQQLLRREQKISWRR